MASPGPSTKIERTEAAVVIQRWSKQVAEGRKERMQAMATAERRRWAVRTLHRAYFNKWRFELARKTALRKQREEAEEEVTLMIVLVTGMVTLSVMVTVTGMVTVTVMVTVTGTVSDGEGTVALVKWT